MSEVNGSNVFVTDFVEREESSFMESEKKESLEWTNEKHSLYIKSIEASFVDQLYNFLDMQQKTYSSDAISAWRNRRNGQCQVLQGGCWSNKNFRRKNSQPKDADRPHVSRHNPWIQHFTNGSKQHVDRPHVYPVPESQLLQETSCSDAELSDQNFVEDTSIEKENLPCNRKKTRTSITVHSSNDQVVPFCTSAATQTAASFALPKK